MPSVPQDGEWNVLSEAIHKEALRREGRSSNAGDYAQDAIVVALSKREQFDPGRKASRTTWVKGIYRKVAANNRRRDEQSPQPLLDFNWPDDAQSGEYEALNRERRDTIAIACDNVYGSPGIRQVVRKAVVLTIAGEGQKTIATRLGIARANNVAAMLSDFRDRFEEEMKREAIGGCIELDGLYCCCAAENRDHGKPFDVAEFRNHDDLTDVGFEWVPRDVDRILKLIAGDGTIPMFVRDVVVDRLVAVSQIATNHSDVNSGGIRLSEIELDIARNAMCLILLPFPSLAYVSSLANFAKRVGIDPMDD